MQYGAPGTEFNVYADGVLCGRFIRWGPYTYQKHNPVSYKPGGYMNGAGHGSTVLGPWGAVLAFCFDVTLYQCELGTSPLYVSGRV